MKKTKTGETLQEAEQRYSLIRHEAYRITEAACHDEMGVEVSLTSISENAAQQADAWEYSEARIHHVPGWSWFKMWRSFRRRPRRVDAAIWSEDDAGRKLLCGLVLGRVSNSRVIASIYYLESNPHHLNPLCGVVTQIAIRYLEIHAFALGCRMIGINQPVPELVDFYSELGFSRRIGKGQKVMRLERELDLAGRP